MKRVEDRFQLIGRNADSRVGHDDLYAALVRGCAQTDLAIACVLHSVR
jgi:hypothetical protein